MKNKSACIHLPHPYFCLTNLKLHKNYTCFKVKTKFLKMVYITLHFLGHSAPLAFPLTAISLPQGKHFFFVFKSFILFSNMYPSWLFLCIRILLIFIFLFLVTLYSLIILNSFLVLGWLCSWLIRVFCKYFSSNEIDLLSIYNSVLKTYPPHI